MLGYRAFKLIEASKNQFIKGLAPHKVVFLILYLDAKINKSYKLDYPNDDYHNMKKE